MGALSALVVVLGLDQFSKAFVVHRLGMGEATAACPGFPVRFRRINNPRPGLGLVGSPLAYAALWGLVIGASWYLAAVRISEQPMALVWLGAALGGMTGNAWDMVWRGGVIDFIDLRVWPVFNLADAAIVCGAVLLGLSLL